MPAILNWSRAMVLVVAALAGGGPAAHADANFLGKTITIFIGYGVGGSYHFYAQLFAHHLGRFLPGQPAIIVQSSPGAGGVRMLNEAAVKMRTDGTNLFIPPDTMVVTQLLQPAGLAYDARKFRYIGTADQQNTFWVVRRGPHSSLEGMRVGETFMGSSGKGSTGYMIPALAAPLLGLKIKHVGGYNSSREMILAMDKGEIDGTLQAWQVWKQSRPSWFEPNGFAVPVIQVGAVSDPDAPNTPLLRDLVAPNDKPLASLFDTIGTLGRSLAAPAAVSEEDLAALRDGFKAMSADPEFIDEAKRTQLRLLPKSGDDLEAAIADAFANSSPDVVRRAQALTQ
ncbi:MAG TPA: hypothetical protein VGJ08_06385 [Rhizomicrobium sp.]